MSLRLSQSKWLVLAACFLFGPAIPAAANDIPPPNILFILADDLGYGDLGCYGCPDISTPHLDHLAAAGVRLTDYYANGPVCTPTRAAFVTGRYQQRIGLDDAVTYQEMGRGLPQGGRTIADTLQHAGYVTGLCGKWHLGYDHLRRPNQQGFAHFFGLLGGNHHYFLHMDRVGVHDLWLQNEAVTRSGYTTDLLTQDAIEFIQRHRKEPFFLYLSHAAPHFPWQGPDDVDKIVEPKKQSWQQGDRATYVAMVERLDAGVGEVLDTLERFGLSDRTLVVFSSDNGGHTHSRNAPLRDFKGTLWEGGIRVPCIARWPGVLPAGVDSPQAAITMDWTATFRSVAGASPDPAGEDGIDLLPFLRGDQAVQDRTLFWQRVNRRNQKNVDEGTAVRHGPWKYTQYQSGDRYLFNLQTDIAETENLVDQYPQRAARMGKLATDWRQTVRDSHLELGD